MKTLPQLQFDATFTLDTEARAKALVDLIRVLKRYGFSEDDVEIVLTTARHGVFNRIFDIEDHVRKRQVIQVVHSTCEMLRRNKV